MATFTDELWPRGPNDGTLERGSYTSVEHGTAHREDACHHQQSINIVIGACVTFMVGLLVLWEPLHQRGMLPLATTASTERPEMLKAASSRSSWDLQHPTSGLTLLRSSRSTLQTMATESMQAEVWQTSGSENGTAEPLKKMPNVVFTEDFVFAGPTIEVGSEPQQVIEGFGGAFTEASATVFAKMSEEHQQQFVEDYFGPNGIGYTVGRVHINSCDFSVSSYSFDDVEDDFDLNHFDDSLARDKEALLPLIHRAVDALKVQNKSLKMLASPWSPPAWMKRNGRMVGSSRPCLRKEAPKSWANYMARWVSAYKAHGVPIWAITTQNEPEHAGIWEACTFTPAQMVEFLGEYLGPAMAAEHPEVSIFVFDHNKDHIYKWAEAIYSDAKAARYATGVAYHWYAGDGFENVRRVHTDFPQAVLLPSEATYERWRWAPHTKLEHGDWSFGLGYAHDIIGDLNTGAVGWIDWNLLLDQTGGPNHVDNKCDAAMMADLPHHGLYKHPQYWCIAHFSKFIPAGSRQLRTTVTGATPYLGATRPYGTCTSADGLEATSSLRPDGAIVTVVLNCADDEIDYKLIVAGRAARLRIPGRSVMTGLTRPAVPTTIRTA